MRRILNCVFRCREHLPCFNEWRDSQTTCFLLFHSDSFVRRRKVLGLSWWSDLFLLPNVALPSFHVIYNPLGWPSSKGSLSYYVAFLWQAKANFFLELFRYHLSSRVRKCTLDLSYSSGLQNYSLSRWTWTIEFHNSQCSQVVNQKSKLSIEKKSDTEKPASHDK